MVCPASLCLSILARTVGLVFRERDALGRDEKVEQEPNERRNPHGHVFEASEIVEQNNVYFDMEMLLGSLYSGRTIMRPL